MLRDKVTELVVGCSVQVSRRITFEDLSSAAEHWDGVLDPDGNRFVIKIVPVQDENDYPLEKITELDAIIHKRLDDMAEILAHGGDLKAKANINLLLRIANSTTKVPSSKQIVSVDPFFRLWNFLDRKYLAEVVDRLENICHIPASTCKMKPLKWQVISMDDPEHLILAKLTRKGMTFPVILKSRLACGFDETHDTAIAWTMRGITSAIEIHFKKNITTWGWNKPAAASTNDLIPRSGFDNIGMELFVQDYIPNHAGTLYKAYRVGKHSAVEARPTGLEDVKDPECGFYSIMRKTQQQAQLESTTFQTSRAEMFKPPKDLISALTLKLTEALGVTLMGVDLLYNEDNGKYAIVDLNYFPTFRGMPRASEKILEHICMMVLQGRKESGGPS